MTREQAIELRVWDKKFNRMLYEVDGWIFNGDGCCLEYSLQASTDNNIDDFILMQFIGKQIKNKKSYVGDILKSKTGIAEIIYNSDLMRFEASSVCGKIALYIYLQKNPDSEIIGNKYQNPELMVIK